MKNGFVPRLYGYSSYMLLVFYVTHVKLVGLLIRGIPSCAAFPEAIFLPLSDR